MFEILENLINEFLAGDSDRDSDYLAERIGEALEEKGITEEQYKVLMSQLDFI